MLKQFQ